MNWKTWVPLTLAIVLGVVAAKVAKDVLAKNKTQPAQAVKLNKVVTAKSDLLPGRQIQAEDLGESQFPPESVPQGAFTDASRLVGRVVEARTIKGQPVLEPFLAPEGAAAGLQALVPKGMRAITVEVNEFSGVAGLLTPGCRVDIIATFQGENGSVARTIVQNVKVTAVGQRVVLPAVKAEDPANPAPSEVVRSITVLVKLKDAEAIELATSTGRPRLVLRSSRDEDVTLSAGITIGELRGSESAANGFWSGAARFFASMKPTTQPSGSAIAKATTKPTAEELDRRVVKVYRGGAESAVTLENPKPNTVEASTDIKSATGQ